MEHNNQLNGRGGPEKGVSQHAPIRWESSEHVAKFYVVQYVRS